MQQIQDDISLSRSLAALEGEALAFAVRMIPDAKARADYVMKAKAYSLELNHKVNAGVITAAQGAKEASQMRNLIMNESRAMTSEIARAYAQNLKLKGLTLQELEQKYAKRLHGSDFNKLNSSAKNRAWKEIVQSAGRPQKKTSKLAQISGKAGRGLIFVTIGVSVYTISTAKDKTKAVANESAILGGGLLGSVAGGATAGFVCGPGAPICSGIGVFLGGLLFAVGADYTFDSFWK